MAATKEHVDNHHLLLVPEKKEKHISENLRVLAIDDNVVCLKVLAFKLKKCGYQVTATTKAEEAIEMLRKNKYAYDIVITDVIRSDMDGFRILEIVGLELDIPVIMISANGDLKTVEKGVKHGARDYLVKPVPIEILKNIWQHVLRKTVSCTAPKSDATEAKSLRNNSFPNNNNKKKRNRGKDHEDHNYDSGQSSEESLLAQKKLRTAWTPRLHEKFLAAVQQLGVEKAVPKKILEIMNESQLTRESVASHLQKYRNLLKKQKEISMNEARQSLMGTNGIPHFSNHINHGGLHGIDQMNSYIDSGLGSFTGRNLPFLPLNYRDTASQQNRVPSESVNLMWKNIGIPELYSMKYHNIDAGGPKNSGSFTDELFVGNSNHNLQVFNRPYSYSPPAFNLDHVHAPHQMFSQPHSPIGQASISLPAMMAAQGDRGMQDKRSLVSYCGNGGSDFREESIPAASPVEHHMQGQIDDSLGNNQVGYTQQSLLDCSERSEIINDLHFIEGSADDDLSVMVKQFACDAAPRI